MNKKKKRHVCTTEESEKIYIVYVVLLMKCNNSSWQLVELPYRIPCDYTKERHINVKSTIRTRYECTDAKARTHNTNTHTHINQNSSVLRGIVWLRKFFMRTWRQTRERERLEYIFNGRITTQSMKMCTVNERVLNACIIIIMTDSEYRPAVSMSRSFGRPYSFFCSHYVCWCCCCFCNGYISVWRMVESEYSEFCWEQIFVCVRQVVIIVHVSCNRILYLRRYMWR